MTDLLHTLTAQDYLPGFYRPEAIEQQQKNWEANQEIIREYAAVIRARRENEA